MDSLAQPFAKQEAVQTPEDSEVLITTTPTTASFPPPPVDTIDWSTLGFTLHEVNGHIESTYSKTTGEWTPLRFVASPYMRIHGMAPALNYGQQAAEGLKAFRGPGDNELAVFRPDRNALRMQHSACVASMPRVPVDMFVQACRAAVALNASFVPPHESGASLYLRPQLYGSSGQLSLTAPEEYLFCVFATPSGAPCGPRPVDALIIDEFDRTAPNGVGHAKLGGNYAPVLRWSDKARDEGYGITLHLDSSRHEDIDEFSTAGFIGVAADESGSHVTLTVPDSKCVIESITSDSLMQIARGFGWTTEKRSIKYAELASFTEVVAVGTALTLVPIRSITRRISPGLLPEGPRMSRAASSEKVVFMPESQNHAGPVCSKLAAQLQAIQLGKVKDDFGWRFAVVQEDGKVDGNM